MDQQKRLFITIALAFGLMLIFQTFVWKPPPAAPGADAGIAAAPVAPAPVAPPVERPLVVAPTPSDLAARSYEVERPLQKLTFTTEGAGLSSAVLLGRREREPRTLTLAQGYRMIIGQKPPPAPHMDMALIPPGGPAQLALAITGAAPLSEIQRYALKEQGPGHIVFTTKSGPWEIEKSYTWNPAPASPTAADNYTLELNVALRNTSDAKLDGQLVVETIRSITPEHEEAPSMFAGIGNQASVVCRVGTDMKRHTPSSGSGCGGASPTTWRDPGTIGLVGIDVQYFLTALWPKNGPVNGDCSLTANPTLRSASLSEPLSVGPGETVRRSFGVFLGPKDQAMLETVSVGKDGAGVAPNLEQTIDMGIWAVIARALVVLLRMFHSISGNWGVAIILLTVLAKVVLLPLTHKAMVSAEAMKKLQPKLEEIRKKFPNDREKQNSEMMRLYQEGKVNPLGGCLPLLLQLPIWGALFTALRTSYELYAEPFLIWADLTAKDPTYLLPIALGVTMIITQRLQPQMTMDKSQAIMMTWVMPIFITVLMMSYPAGLALYIFTNNILSIIQQFALRKYLERNAPATP